MGKQEDLPFSAHSKSATCGSVRLWFTDVLGYLKSVSVAPAELENAFSEGIGFDGSAIEGFARVTEADMLRPPRTPRRSSSCRGAVGTVDCRMFCDINMPDGSPSYADPRFVLKRTLQGAAEKGFTFYTHPEIEFYLFQGRPGAGEDPVRWNRAATSTTPRSRGGRTFAARRSTCSSRWASPWNSATTREARASRRSTCAHADALSTADNIMTFRTVVREVALSQGIWASFMPKPFTTHPGSGMHTHVSLFEGDSNAFFEAGAEYPAVEDCPTLHRRHPAPRQRADLRDQPVGQLLQAADRRR